MSYMTPTGKEGNLNSINYNISWKVDQSYYHVKLVKENMVYL